MSLTRYIQRTSELQTRAHLQAATFAPSPSFRARGNGSTGFWTTEHPAPESGSDARSGDGCRPGGSPGTPARKNPERLAGRDPASQYRGDEVPQVRERVRGGEDYGPRVMTEDPVCCPDSPIARGVDRDDAESSRREGKSAAVVFSY
jgi:hypothetical protein